MVMSTGTTVPRWDSVAALYCLQNSMVWTPCGPRAVPTGGAGVADPASNWILTVARTRFLGGIVSPVRCGGLRSLELRDLAEFELDRGLPAEDVDEHLQLQLVLVDFGDLTGEVGEGAFLHPHRLVDLVLEARPAPLGGGLGALGLHLEDALDLASRQRRRLGPGADEAGHPRGVADGTPGVVVEVAAHQEVAREDLLRDRDLLAALELDDVLHRDDDLEDPVLHVAGGDDVGEVGADLVLVARVGVDHVPTAGAVVGARDVGVLLPLFVLVLVAVVGVLGLARRLGGIDHQVRLEPESRRRRLPERVGTGGAERHVLGLDLAARLAGVRRRVRVGDRHFWNMNRTALPKPKLRTKIRLIMRMRVVTTTAV